MENAQKKLVQEKVQTPINTKELMDQLRSDITKAVKEGRSAVSKFYPLKPKNSFHDYPPLSSAEDLSRINVLFQELYQSPSFSSHRPVVGKVISKLKTKFATYVWNVILGDYLKADRSFNEHLVRYLNFSSQTIDHKFVSLMSEVVQKIDSDINSANERTDRVINELDSTFRTFENIISIKGADLRSEFEGVRASVGVLAGQIKTIDNVARGLERTLSLLSKAGVSDAESKATAIDIDYLLLENRFRGSEEQITQSVKDYIPLLKSANGEILDIGCGRGELLEALREDGLPAQGIDLDKAMVLRCKEKGLNVQLVDLFDYLAASNEESFGAIIATQVVEHLTQTQLDKFISLALKRLKPGGLIILETINPQSVTALARNFFRDPTHTFPVHPETLKFALEMKGFSTKEIIYRSPYPVEAILTPLDYSPDLPARWLTMLSQLNDNFTRLNNLLFGFQDFAVVGVKATDTTLISGKNG
jgi:2-polyprenyl-3-methyl-5-hydroxy-6-metoxy-1,4-benzoquinol methylase